MPLALLLAACSGGGGSPAPPTAPTLTDPTPPPTAPSDPTPPPPPALFVLGDSLSDIGNVAAVADYALNQPIDPPTVGLCNPTEVLVLKRRCDDLFYLESRVTDGPVAVERLAADLGLAPLRPSLHVIPNQPRAGTVYAVGGAKARGTRDSDLARQVDWLLIDRAPLPQGGNSVVFQPMRNGVPSGEFEVFAEGFSPPGASPQWERAERRDAGTRTCRASA